MSDTVRFAEFDGQHVELLPARTVLSVFAQIPVGDASTTNGGTNSGGGLSLSPTKLLGLTGSNTAPDGTNADGNSGDAHS